MPMSAVTSTFDTNVFGAIRVAKVVAPHMITQKSGLIVNISSIASGVYVISSDCDRALSAKRYRSPTPWSAPYNASKAALNAITDSLDMELRPFNVNVMLLIAGLVTSNIADNHAAHIVRPSADSPYAPFTDKIVGRLYTSQEECVATAAFARTVVKQALRERPPSYLVLGGNTVPFRILQWLPRKVVLGLSWTVFSDKVGLLRWIKKLGSMFD
jgi:1-acylglycerone phosphate reductase